MGNWKLFLLNLFKRKKKKKKRMKMRIIVFQIKKRVLGYDNKSIFKYIL